MKKVLLLPILATTLVLTSCTFSNNVVITSNTSFISKSTSTSPNNNSGNTTTKTNPTTTRTTTTTQKNTSYVEIYTDSNSIENDSILLTMKKPSCYTYNTNYSFSVSFDLKNKTYSTQSYKISNVELIKESTKASYTTTYQKSLSIEAELTKTLSFSATIPSSIETDNYKLTFELNTLKVDLHLYEIPDSLRADRTVSYYIDNKVVKTTTVKEGRALNEKYCYESDDHLYYCNTWYNSPTFASKVSETTIIKENMKLYGNKSEILKYTTTGSDVYSFITGVNHVPTDGILLIPETHGVKELAIGNYAIRNMSLAKIYVPKTVHIIYGGNFTNIGNATIYYEGTEEEWVALFYNRNEAPKTNVIYNTKYSNK